MLFLSLALRAVSALGFVLAGANQLVLDQPQLDVIAFSLALWVVATVVDRLPVR